MGGAGRAGGGEGALERVLALEGDDTALLDAKVDALWRLGREAEAAVMARSLLRRADGDLDAAARRAVVATLASRPQGMLDALGALWRATIRLGEPTGEPLPSQVEADIERRLRAVLRTPTLFRAGGRLGAQVQAMQQALAHAGRGHGPLMRVVLWLRVRLLRHQGHFAEADRQQALRHLADRLTALLGPHDRTGATCGPGSARSEGSCSRPP